MKSTSGFIASSRRSNTYPWLKVMLYFIWFIALETKGFSISLTVSDLIFLRKRVVYPLGFKTLNKTVQASLKLCLLLEFL